jgi:hypothetical protein
LENGSEAHLGGTFAVKGQYPQGVVPAIRPARHIQSKQAKRLISGVVFAVFDSSSRTALKLRGSL